jgi:protein ImuB
MAERVRWQMEAWVATRGVTSGVVLVRLSPVGVRAREGRQLGLWGGSSEADEWAARAVERLAALLGPHSVHVAEWKGGRDAGEVFVLAPTAVIDMQRRSESVVTNEQQWSGALPTPSPSLIYAEPLPAMVVDAEDNVLRVNGRHELSAPPACVVVGQHRYSVVSWAGPWPVEECWWDPLRHRRLVRIQLVLQGIIAGGPQAVLLALEHGEWWVLGKFG